MSKLLSLHDAAAVPVLDHFPFSHYFYKIIKGKRYYLFRAMPCQVSGPDGSTGEIWIAEKAHGWAQDNTFPAQQHDCIIEQKGFRRRSSGGA